MFVSSVVSVACRYWYEYHAHTGVTRTSTRTVPVLVRYNRSDPTTLTLPQQTYSYHSRTLLVPYCTLPTSSRQTLNRITSSERRPRCLLKTA